MNSLHTLEAPTSEEVGQTVEEFLQRLGGPTWLRIPGHDRSRRRAITTLLHGNEPSGIRALHRWIQSGQKPLVDLVCFVGAVDAALTPPRFGHRFLPGHKDLNRCFRNPFMGVDGQIAKALLQRLREAKPEALIDLHNASGRSPAYGVTTQLGLAQEVLTSLFSDHLILTDLRLGTLMEATEHDFPTITVECGGASDPESDGVAMKGLTHYAMAESVLVPRPTFQKISVLKHPIRVELREDAKIVYDTAPIPKVDITLRPDIDRYNFGVLKPGEVLGWVGSRRLEALIARDARGRDRTQEIFTAQDGCLQVSQPARLLMMTTNPDIAQSDCLFYFLPTDCQG